MVETGEDLAAPGVHGAAQTDDLEDQAAAQTIDQLSRPSADQFGVVIWHIHMRSWGRIQASVVFTVAILLSFSVQLAPSDDSASRIVSPPLLLVLALLTPRLSSPVWVNSFG
jgi:hypothetical protein